MLKKHSITKSILTKTTLNNEFIRLKAFTFTALILLRQMLDLKGVIVCYHTIEGILFGNHHQVLKTPAGVLCHSDNNGKQEKGASTKQARMEK